MSTRTLIPFSAVMLAALVGCGDASNPASGSGGSGTTGATTSNGGSGTTTTPSGSGGAAGDAVTFTMTPFTVPAGGEVYKCQNFANPFGGADAEVALFESHMTPGSHHLLLFYKDGATDSPLEDCSGLEFAATPYSTQLPDDSIAFPPGVAALVTSKTGIRLQSHYLNTTGQPIEAHVSATLHLAEPGTVTDHAGVLFVVEPKIFILPNSTATVSHDCNLPFDMKLIKAASHMHQHGTHFTATIAGDTVFETTQWDEPKPVLFDPAKAVKGGDPLHFECSFTNNGPQTLTFGESASSNEMCIFVSSFYPVPTDALTTVPCQ